MGSIAVVAKSSLADTIVHVEVAEAGGASIRSATNRAAIRALRAVSRGLVPEVVSRAVAVERSLVGTASSAGRASSIVLGLASGAASASCADGASVNAVLA